MHRICLLAATALLWLPSAAMAQALSLSTANASGDCIGTSFSQMADASGKFLSASWAAANQFPAGVNKGRARCVLRWTVTIPAGYKFVAGGGGGSPTRIANATFQSLRLNGSTSRALVESIFSVDGAGAMKAAALVSGGPLTGATLPLERDAMSAVAEGSCATPTKTSFQIGLTVDAATSSNYVIPWPPEPYADREVASMGQVRLFYTLTACPTRRSGVET